MQEKGILTIQPGVVKTEKRWEKEGRGHVWMKVGMLGISSDQLRIEAPSVDSMSVYLRL